MLVTGDLIDAETAADWGLVNPRRRSRRLRRHHCQLLRTHHRQVPHGYKAR